MKIVLAPRGILEIDDARIIFRNFRGEGSKFNRPGDRNFALFIAGGVFDDGKQVYELDAEGMKDMLLDYGWNVKIKAPREEGDEPFMYLPVKIKCNDRGPAMYLKSGGNLIKLDEESMDMLDEIDIVKVDMDLRPFDWEMNGDTGRTAYLQSIHVVQEIDRFAARYAEEEHPEE